VRNFYACRALVSRVQWQPMTRRAISARPSHRDINCMQLSTLGSGDTRQPMTWRATSARASAESPLPACPPVSSTFFSFPKGRGGRGPTRCAGGWGRAPACPGRDVTHPRTPGVTPSLTLGAPFRAHSRPRQHEECPKAHAHSHEHEQDWHGGPVLAPWRLERRGPTCWAAT